ncbi:MND1-interacting protein 1-like isoform X2 [Malania oleifera]|nr:MND1-interacting protein 1-like isoform X2 [Malania oleifera]
MEELLLKRLEVIYVEAFQRLLGYGYHGEVVRKAILMNGHGFGNMDILTNIVQNSLAYINTGMVIDSGNYSEDEQVFGEFSQLVKYSLAVMVYLLQQVQPSLNKDEALWSLLASNFHLGLASNLTAPFLPGEDEVDNNNLVDVSSGVACVQRDQDSGDYQTVDFQNNYPSERNFDELSPEDAALAKKFNLSAYCMSHLKRNAAKSAAALRAKMKTSQEKLPDLPCHLASNKLTSQQDLQKPDLLISVLDSLGNFSLDAESKTKCVNEKNEMIMNLVSQIKEVEAQVKEQKDWAQKKVIQAARKLSQDLSELNTLRMEREDKHCLKIGNEEIQEETVKRLLEMENALRKSSCQVDQATAAVRNLENENSVIRAEIEAFKLSAGESDRIRLEVEKKERKCLKRLTALEKQNNKFREEIEEERKKSLQLRQQLAWLVKTQDEIEVKWREEVKAKELAVTQVQEEQRLKKAAEVSFKRKMEALRQKMELDCQHFKDDVQRLEQEISCIQKSLYSTELTQSQAQRCMLETLPPESNNLNDLCEEDVFYDRECFICMVNEASVVFLPCAHQIMCSNCSERYCNFVEARCPCCQVWIVQRIRVYGAGS